MTKLYNERLVWLATDWPTNRTDEQMRENLLALNQEIAQGQ